MKRTYTFEVNLPPAAYVTSFATALFVGLKLTGLITWPWIWVLSPVWLPIAIALAGALIYAIGCCASLLVELGDDI